MRAGAEASSVSAAFLCEAKGSSVTDRKHMAQAK